MTLREEEEEDEEWWWWWWLGWPWGWPWWLERGRTGLVGDSGVWAMTMWGLAATMRDISMW